VVQEVECLGLCGLFDGRFICEFEGADSSCTNPSSICIVYTRLKVWRNYAVSPSPNILTEFFHALDIC
jgi:hypothetical protein